VYNAADWRSCSAHSTSRVQRRIRLSCDRSTIECGPSGTVLGGIGTVRTAEISTTSDLGVGCLANLAARESTSDAAPRESENVSVSALNIPRRSAGRARRWFLERLLGVPRQPSRSVPIARTRRRRSARLADGADPSSSTSSAAHAGAREAGLVVAEFVQQALNETRRDFSAAVATGPVMASLLIASSAARG
jgi:hypothetical protein